MSASSCQTSYVLVIRGTKKLRDRVKGQIAGGDDRSTTVLGDWFATALFWRPQVALLVNRRTLLPVFVPLAPAATLTARVPAAIAGALRAHGASEAFIDAELAAMSDVCIAPTDDRSVLGVMNEFAMIGERLFCELQVDIESLGPRLSQMVLGPLRYGEFTPERELAAFLRSRPDADDMASAGSMAQTGEGRPPGTAYQLKITLLDTKPPVWRRILVDPATTLDELHDYIQAAMGWWNCHLYEFTIARSRYGVPDPDWDIGLPMQHAHRFALSKLAAVGDSFRYTYDFGDGWEHKVTVEKSVARTAAMTVPACVGGRRACPPEDCGGPWGYRELLSIVGDPSHPEHAERMAWLDGWEWDVSDPDAFDPEGFDDHLAELQSAVF